MPENLPYLASYKNVGLLFDRVAAAKAPDAFTQRYLADTLGLKSTGDRQLIALLKALGFIDQNGRPTTEYGKLKNRNLARSAIATGIKTAYAPLYAANENAHNLDFEALKGLVAQVAGSDEQMTKKIAGTFNSVVKAADFNAAPEPEVDRGDAGKPNGGDTAVAAPRTEVPMTPVPKGIRSEFHFNIQVHLPSNGTEETYLNIFNAIRRTFS